MRAAIRPMTASNKAAYQSLSPELRQAAGQGVTAAHPASRWRRPTHISRVAEAYSGNYKAKTDYNGNVCAGCNLDGELQITVNNAIYALTGNALASKNATRYISPVASGCTKNYIIYISNGPKKKKKKKKKKGKEGPEEKTAARTRSPTRS